MSSQRSPYYVGMVCCWPTVGDSVERFTPRQWVSMRLTLILLMQTGYLLAPEN